MASNDFYCVCCKQGPHQLTECRIFRILEASERRYICNSYRVCRLCLKAGHLTDECTELYGEQERCRKTYCASHGAKHHRWLHERVKDTPENDEIEDCWKCGEDHLTVNCPIFQSMSTTERLVAVNTSNACTLCLRIGHYCEDCEEEDGEDWCSVCRSQFHHTLLHLEGGHSSVESTDQPQQPENVVTPGLFENQGRVNTVTERIETLQQKEELSAAEMMELLELGQQLLEEDGAPSAKIRKTE